MTPNLEYGDKRTLPKQPSVIVTGLLLLAYGGAVCGIVALGMWLLP